MSKSKKNSSKTMSLEQFQKLHTAAPAPSSSSSWGEQMEDDDDYSSNTGGSINDLRSEIDAKQSSRRSPFSSSSSSSFHQQRNQFEDGAEDQSSQWSRERPSYGGDRPSYGGDRPSYGGDRPSYGSEIKSMDEYTFPTQAPFILFIRNLPFETTRDDVADFFEQLAKVNVENVILPVDREREGRIKGRGYVEFADLESLKSALGLNGKSFMGRNIFIDVTDPETAQKMSLSNKDSYSSNREPTIADSDDAWRTGSSKPDLFGRGQRQSSSSFSRSDRYEQDQEGRSSHYREREPEGPSFEEKFAMQRQRKQDNRGFGFSSSSNRATGEDRPQRKSNFGRYGGNNEVDESDPLFLATSSQTERPKIQLKERSVPLSTDNKSTSGSSSSIFGEGKAWEETEELRNRVEKLSVIEKKQQQSSTNTTTTTTATNKNTRSFSPAFEEGEGDDGFEKMGGKNSKKKSMDFNNFRSDRRSATGHNSSSDRKPQEPATTTTNKKQEREAIFGKKQDKPKTENVWAALASVDE